MVPLHSCTFKDSGEFFFFLFLFALSKLYKDAILNVRTDSVSEHYTVIQVFDFLKRYMRCYPACCVKEVMGKCRWQRLREEPSKLCIDSTSVRMCAQH